MPYGVIISTAEADLVRAIWGDAGVPMIRTESNVLWFDPHAGKRIVTAISEFDLGAEHDENTQRRLLDRIAALVGKPLVDVQPAPIASEPETMHIEDNEPEAEATV